MHRTDNHSVVVVIIVLVMVMMMMMMLVMMVMMAGGKDEIFVTDFAMLSPVRLFKKTHTRLPPPLIFFSLCSLPVQQKL